MFDSIFGFWGMGVCGFLLEIAVFFVVIYCIGCLLSGRGSSVDRGAGLVFVLILVVPASIGLSTLAYYGAQSAVALYVEAIDQARKTGEATSETNIPEAQTEPQSNTEKWFEPHGNNPEFGAGTSGKKKINL
ncbi:MAG: hypothetical protein WAU31_02980 [Candidatus Moraniibacteriota bacterium]